MLATTSVRARRRGRSASIIYSAIILFLVSCYWAVPFIRPPLGVTTHIGLPEITSVWLFLSLFAYTKYDWAAGRIAITCLLFVLVIWLSFLVGSLFFLPDRAISVVFVATLRMSLWMLILSRVLLIDWQEVEVNRVLVYVYVFFLIPVFFAVLEWREIVAIQFYSNYPALWLPRIHSTVGFTSVNMGIMCAFNILIGMWLIHKETMTWRRLAYMALMVLYFSTLVIVRHRTSVIALAICGVFYLLLLVHRRKNFFLWVLLGIAALSAIFDTKLGMELVSHNLKEGIVETISDRNEFLRSTGGHRVSIWQNSIAWLSDNTEVFFLGSGIGSWRFLLPLGTGAHNQYLHTFAEVGFIGWFVFFSIFAQLILSVSLSRRPSPYRILCASLLLFVFVSMATQETLWPQFAAGNIALFQFVIIALVFRARQANEAEMNVQYHISAVNRKFLV